MNKEKNNSTVKSRLRQKEAVRLAGWPGIATLLLVLFGASVSAMMSAQTLSEFPLPAAGSSPTNIAAGSDGSLWFTENGSNKIGRISTDGVVTGEFSIPTASANPLGIAAGPDGSLWFTEGAVAKIGRITTGGVITEFPLSSSSPAGIAAGPDGNLWFTEFYSDKIGRITTTGSVTAHFSLAGDPIPNEIAAGPDGNLWFTEFGGFKIGRITTAGVVTEFANPSNSTTSGIAAGPDGNLWFTETVGKIGRITTAGITTEFSLPFGAHAGAIAAGPDSGLWFIEDDKIGRMTTAGAVTEFSLPSGSNPGDIAAGPDGNLWFTEIGRNSIGRIVPGHAGQPGACVADSTTLCLNDGRFQVQAQWQAPALETSGRGIAVPLTSNTGSFWFFDSTNIEVVVKVLNACSFDGHQWVFAGGLTNVGVMITITDTQTGAAATYTNSAGTAFQPIQDTAAFSTCP